ncbi:MAG: radical SAM protein [Elusimicrobia bacterium]|nr:radical SAM protein [Elusimicrobiota bacterium]
MKLLLLNIPLGPYATTDAPVAITRVIENLDPALDCETSFYDVYLETPTLEQILARVKAFEPDVIGLSAILSHNYGYVKKLSLYLKENYPRAVQVLGGEMASVGNIVVRRTAVDFCVTGESEPTFSALLGRLKESDFHLEPRARFKDIPGLIFMLDGESHFTGYATEKREVLQINYDLVARFSNINHYLEPAFSGQRLRRSYNKTEMDDFFVEHFRPENLHKLIGQVSASIGCVAKCTFCHRFYKGYTAADPKSVNDYIDMLVEKYDVGTIFFWEENWGSDKKATRQIVEHLKARRLNWIAGATRVSTIDDETIREWKEAGCVQIGFGIETGSQKILDTMEKKTTVRQNVEALRSCYRHRLLTCVLVLLGMPGETEETVDETIRNLSTALPEDIRLPYDMAINFFQAIPGTPGYEYARAVGLIGSSLDEEERYLEGLYDVDASSIKHYLNFTDYEREEIVYWRHYVLLELTAAYMRKHGVLNCLRHRKARRYKYALVYMSLPRPVRRFLLKYGEALWYFGLGGFSSLLYRKVFRARPKRFSGVDRSLRALLRAAPLPIRDDDRNTAVLRAGR